MIISQRIDNACGVGINPHGQDWKKIYDRMSTFPKGVVLDADGKNFETTFFSDQKDNAIIELINSIYEKSDMYNQGDNEIRLELWNLVRRNVILVNGILYKLPGGNTSGNAVTLLKNTMNNLLTYRAMWYAILEENDIPFKDYEYNDCCRDLATGDDIIINKREDVDFINMKTLSAMFKKHGMLITPADKSPIEQYKEKTSVLQLDYCSRGFGFDTDGFITAPLKYTSIMGMLFWVHGDKKLLCSKMNADTALQELYYYGREHYNEVAEAIVQGFRHKNVVYHAKTFEEQHAERMDRYTSNSTFRLDMY